MFFLFKLRCPTLLGKDLPKDFANILFSIQPHDNAYNNAILNRACPLRSILRGIPLRPSP